MDTDVGLFNSFQFQARYGKHIIKTYRPTATVDELDSGANVSFPEFVKFLLNEGVNTNEHWAPIYNLCLPCTLNYSFIGNISFMDEMFAEFFDIAHFKWTDYHRRKIFTLIACFRAL